MGFREVKSKVVADLLAGNYQHEVRNGIDDKNLLATGEVSREWVAELLKSARGHEYQSSPHHQAPSVTVYVVKTRTWYIKFYFYPHTLFISVHQ